MIAEDVITIARLREFLAGCDERYASSSDVKDYATQLEAETGTNNTKVMTPLRTAQEIAAKTDSALSSSSNNPVRNSVIKQALDNKLDTDDYRAGMTWGELEGALTWGDLEHDLSDTGTTTTENYDLVKPGLNSDAGIGPINDNMDAIDEILADKLDDADYRKAMTWGEVGDKYNWGVLGTTSQTTGTTYTDVLGLEKPGNNSTVDVSTINDNYDAIDESVECTQSSIAMIESSTAQSNHAIGSYFMLDNVLHKATSAIASGETITSGSNATPITIEEALISIKNSIKSPLDSYPVGSIYVSVNSASPATLFGGTWQRITGRFLLAATDGGTSGASQAAGRTGGEATHALTPAETALKNHSHTMNHSHSLNNNRGAGWDSSGGDGDRLTYGNVKSGRTMSEFASVSEYKGSTSGLTEANGTAHNNMPPYLSVYVWKRTA